MGGIPRVKLIEIPYEGDQPLEIDRSTSSQEDRTDPLSWVVANLAFLLETGTSIEELDRIFRGTVVLHADDAGTFAECFHQAIVWERG